MIDEESCRSRCGPGLLTWKARHAKVKSLRCDWRGVFWSQIGVWTGPIDSSGMTGQAEDEFQSKMKGKNASEPASKAKGKSRKKWDAEIEPL